ncbi:hypothetical protein [Actinoplanes couchii]|uniref:Lipoprotein n=1 Tax=Actinoplanes couchii TaxID=403638 RepID=A0ABQ3XEM2_9ACTN|nr:hypothetical protein [Actinoplanes couchii]MDR6319816.1 hypothetical protein [Actinoplanes couchii]GID56951.1 hypothetical protein Aco03nite_053550 [Actinoplanes couchii]
MSARYRLLLVAPALMVALSACSFSGTVGSAPEAAAPAPEKTTASSPAPEKTTASSPAPEKTTASSPAPGKTTADPAPKPDECPSAQTLEGLTTELPEGWSFTDVTCAEGWAAATPKGPKTGDGVYLFQKTGTTWKYHSQGSGFDCKDLGLDAAPFCIS